MFYKMKDNKGVAMIMTICLMGIVVVLCLSIILAASIVLNSSQREMQDERCKIAAVSLSESLKNEITDIDYTFTNENEENISRQTNGSKLWFYLRDNVWTNSWPYYNEDERGHTETYAYRTFKLNSSMIPADLRSSAKEIDNLEMTMYWSSSKDAAKNETPLTIIIRCDMGKSKSIVKSEYTLVDKKIEGYDQWVWSFNNRE